MKTFIPIIILLFLVTNLSAHGVAIVESEKYLTLIDSEVNVEVKNQIAVVTSTQTFINNDADRVKIRYAFPLNLEANAIKLRWFLKGEWFTADVSKKTQDTTIPTSGGGNQGTDPALTNYLGNSALFFTLLDSIAPEEQIIFELTYVELFKYEFGIVQFDYPADYSAFTNNGPIERAVLNFQVESDRTITSIESPDFSNAVIQITGNNGSVQIALNGVISNPDYRVEYSLSSDELGVYNMSTILPDSLQKCDDYGNGFLSLIIEPESNEDVEVIEKNFTLVIDRSGSMGGTKIVQARDAASFIVNHLNIGDNFNIIDFSGNVNSYAPAHLPYNLTNRDDALQYIDGIGSGGSTNISGALTTAISQFGFVDPDKANTIIFFTDGEATAGVSSTPGILDAVRNAVSVSETEIFLFTFGIGQGANKQLLTLLAQENSGLAEFLGNDELLESITKFFLTINNPVLLNPVLTFEPDILEEVYPSPLPNFYKGQQVIMTARYNDPQLIKVKLTGKAFSIPVEYTYDVQLADNQITEHSFLPKIWAKQKIGSLTIDYNTRFSGDPMRDTLEATIDSISTCYEVISTQFTSFSTNTGNGTGTTSSMKEIEFDDSEAFVQVVIMPNPFSETATFHLHAPMDLNEEVTIYIYNELGQLVKTLKSKFLRNNKLSIPLDETANWPAGLYYCKVQIGNNMKTLKLIKQ